MADNFTYFEPRLNYRYTADYIAVERTGIAAIVRLEAADLPSILDGIHRMENPRAYMPYIYNLSTRQYELIPFIHV